MAVAGVFGLLAETARVTVVSVPTVVLAGVAVTELMSGGFGPGGGGGAAEEAPTADAPGHRFEWKTGSAIGGAHGAGSNWPTTVVPEPGPPIGPEPQNRNGRSWKLFSTIGVPKLRFSAKMNSNTGKVYLPGIRPIGVGVVEACLAVGLGAYRGSIWQIVCSAGVSAPFTPSGWHMVRLTAR